MEAFSIGGHPNMIDDVAMDSEVDNDEPVNAADDSNSMVNNETPNEQSVKQWKCPLIKSNLTNIDFSKV